MLYLRMFQAKLNEENFNAFWALKSRLSERLQPLLRPALQAPASVLSAAPEDLRKPNTAMRGLSIPDVAVLDGEIFTDRRSLIVLSVTPGRQKWPAHSRLGTIVQEEEGQLSYQLRIAAIGQSWESETLTFVLAATQETLGVQLTPFWFTSKRFNELRAEGREAAPEPTRQELQAAELLQDRVARTLTLAIRASGGLLVRDLLKQVSADAHDRIEGLTENLKDTRLIESEIVVVCTKTHGQITRSPTREVINELSEKGIKCACGKPLNEERMEEALTITDLGRSLLEKSRWLTILLVEELCSVGLTRDAMLLGQSPVDDGVDCIANISGEVTLFELAEREFNLGDAYSLGAKIGVIRPQNPVIITTERVGNDAKEHFIRARLTGAAKEFDDPLTSRHEEPRERGEITYIEGVENLHPIIERVANGIYQKDAIQCLNSVLSLAAFDGRSLLRALEGVINAEESRSLNAA